MRGVDAATGKHLNDRDHLQQSVRDILTTRIGTRIERRDYGSRLPELIDSPVAPGTVIEFYAATAEALDTWEPRLQLERVVIVTVSNQGGLELDLHGVYLPDGRPITVEGISIERR